ncbi:hypothetical protein G4B88_013720 [Cannabis sativa]|uniref:Uncharacterized protein n=1 Tax=Cannabis sativa TaxID=3483 RepID=A0A7J6HUU3_CANSA|nr:hypothetical protein G4B88_013720 [Cannabis sativa]
MGCKQNSKNKYCISFSLPTQTNLMTNLATTTASLSRIRNNHQPNLDFHKIKKPNLGLLPTRKMIFLNLLDILKVHNKCYSLQMKDYFRLITCAFTYVQSSTSFKSLKNAYLQDFLKIKVQQIPQNPTINPTAKLMKNPLLINASSFSRWPPSLEVVDKLLLDKSNVLRRSTSDNVEGIFPEKLFLDKSRASRDTNFPISVGIFPLKLFLDKFKETKPLNNTILRVLKNELHQSHLLENSQIDPKSPNVLNCQYFQKDQGTLEQSNIQKMLELNLLIHCEKDQDFTKNVLEIC